MLREKLAEYDIQVIGQVFVPDDTKKIVGAINEFGATIMITGKIPGKTRTMSVAVYTAMQSGSRKMAFIWTSIILMISFSTLILINYLTGRKFRKESDLT